MKNVRTRFAPSPTGYMHIGNLRTALYAYLVAKKEKDGVFMLRIEDTDQNRQVEGAVDIIYETLKTCKLTHDEGPDVGGKYGPYVQSDRVKAGIYKKYALEMVEKSKAHFCFCKEEDIAAQREIASAKGISFIYDDPCKLLKKEEIDLKLQNNEPYVIRQNIDKIGTTDFVDEVYGTISVDNSTLDEMVLLKSDGFPTYNFANVIDDHLMEITHVVRGNEYLSSTPKYNLIYEAFGWEKPKYIHCPPVMKDETHKLSKRNGDASFQDLVSKGYLPEAILNYIALLGWSPQGEEEIFSLTELCEKFDIKRIGTSGSIFDINKLTWLNGVYIRNMDFDKYYELVLPYIKNVVTKNYDFVQIAKILKDRINIFSEINEAIDFIEELKDYDNSLFINSKMKTDKDSSILALEKSLELFEGLNDNEFNYEFLHDKLLSLPTIIGIKNGQLLYPLRVALSGKAFTPGGSIEISSILKKEESIKRIKYAINKLKS